MAGNSFGTLFRVTTFGESHGLLIGCVVDGCPPKLSLSVSDIQPDLDRRRPGQNSSMSQRKESDTVEIVSGIFEGQTTGAPITLFIQNEDAKTKDYEKFKGVFRPGHGDYSYFKKYGIWDYRGGGRASARETASRVAAGAIAKKYLAEHYDIQIFAKIIQVGELKGEDCQNHEKLQHYIQEIRRQKESVGAKIEVVATAVPPGLGEPVFDRLDAELAKAWMGIPAVKAVEIGDGIDCVLKKGSEFRDEIFEQGFHSNHAGGILAGISTGQAIVGRVYFKPASSIPKEAQTVTVQGDPTEIEVTGRHDPCVGLRAPVIVEAMTALVLMDHVLRHRALG